MSAMNYNDRVVIVTGAGGGLGAAYANFFASRGAKVGGFALEHRLQSGCTAILNLSRFSAGCRQ